MTFLFTMILCHFGPDLHLFAEPCVVQLPSHMPLYFRSGTSCPWFVGIGCPVMCFRCLRTSGRMSIAHHRSNHATDNRIIAAFPLYQAPIQNHNCQCNIYTIYIIRCKLFDRYSKKQTAATNYLSLTIEYRVHFHDYVHILLLLLSSISTYPNPNPNPIISGTA